jgi:hypothetical protein
MPEQPSLARQIAGLLGEANQILAHRRAGEAASFDDRVPHEVRNDDWAVLDADASARRLWPEVAR